MFERKPSLLFPFYVFNLIIKSQILLYSETAPLPNGQPSAPPFAPAYITSSLSLMQPLRSRKHQLNPVQLIHLTGTRVIIHSNDISLRV